MNTTNPTNIPMCYNYSTQEYIPEYSSTTSLRDAPPLSNYKEVDYEKLYLDADLELYFAHNQLFDIKKVLFPSKCVKVTE